MSDSPCDAATLTEGPPTYPVTISFVGPGARPPVYVAGSFTVPEWQPHELGHLVLEHDTTVADDRISYVFRRTFDVPQGTYQYKFRLGHEGDWWVCDDSVQTGTKIEYSFHRCILLISHPVTDALGNQNNRLVVTALPSEPDALDPAAADRTSYLLSTMSGTTQPAATCSPIDHPQSLSPREERRGLTGSPCSAIGNTPPPTLDQDRQSILSVPSDCSRRRMEASVDSSDSSGDKSRTSRIQPRSILQRIFQLLHSVWYFVFGRKAQ
ncbi:MAG: hypothetical protein Q9171_000868 [Xanthocarpia ochracea]